MAEKKGRGGARKGAGRPAKAKPLAITDKSVASAVLATLDEIAVWRFLLHADALEDPAKRDKLTAKERDQIGDHMEYLTNRRDGKPAESIIAEGKLEIIVKEMHVGAGFTTEAGDVEKVM
jgi:hypothetical protein